MSCEIFMFSRKVMFSRKFSPHFSIFPHIFRFLPHFFSNIPFELMEEISLAFLVWGMVHSLTQLPSTLHQPRSAPLSPSHVSPPSVAAVAGRGRKRRARAGLLTGAGALGRGPGAGGAGAGGAGGGEHEDESDWLAMGWEDEDISRWVGTPRLVCLKE